MTHELLSPVKLNPAMRRNSRQIFYMGIDPGADPIKEIPA